MKIAAYVISKDEEKFIRRCLESCADMDLFLLADTGSKDKTVEITQQYRNTRTFDISVQPFRFDDARNAALSLVPADIDICVSLDVDEIMVPGWREEVERCWTSDATRMSYLFDWSAGIQFKSDKIHARKGYRWVKPCHECLVPTRITEKFVYSEELLIKHLPDNTKSRADYFPLLEVSYQENPTDPRALLYFGRELLFRKDYERAKQIIEQYRKVSTWQAEKAYATLLVGDIHMHQGNIDLALIYYHDAAYLWPEYRDPFLRLSFYFFNLNDWRNAKKYALAAIRIQNRVYHYFEDAKSWSAHPYDIAALSSHFLGERVDALDYGRKALDLEPNDPRLINNLEFYK